MRLLIPRLRSWEVFSLERLDEHGGEWLKSQLPDDFQSTCIFDVATITFSSILTLISSDPPPLFFKKIGILAFSKVSHLQSPARSSFAVLPTTFSNHLYLRFDSGIPLFDTQSLPCRILPAARCLLPGLLKV